MSQQPASATDALAVIGMSGRFPGASTVEDFWENLREGVESIRFFSYEELAAGGIPPEVAAQPGYVPAAGVIDGIELFDARFFGFSPRDAEMLDPQQRLFLECSWEALERAGCDPDRFPGLIGVYAGTSLSSYALHNLYPITGIPGGLDDFQVFLSNDKDHLTTRVSYKLNLRGPSITVQTACSTSLVAVCLACESLNGFQCDVALAGGVTIRVPQCQGYVYQEGGIGSPDGHCRTFDADAKGTVGSSGIAVVALKRLSDAIADRDPIHAVIRGWALNNDGAAKVGYTAPSVSGQVGVIAAALALAGVGPETISYIEAHGTATPIGDPIEVAALSEVFSKGRVPSRSCAIGSLKSSVGHLDSAAGGAALIKTVLALEHKTLPPSLHFKTPNPEIDFESGPFFVNDRPREWATTQLPRRAGVSSFGIGGTNAHVVVEEAPGRGPSTPSTGPELILLSAQNQAALDRAAAGLAGYLSAHPDVNLGDVSYTLKVGRKGFSHRRAIIARDVDDARTCLISLDPARIRDQVSDRPPATLAFLFPGQGAQHLNMALGLYKTHRLFASDITRGAEQILDELGFDLCDAIYPAAAGQEAEERLTSTAVAQPALFLVEYALARLWMHWGITPNALLGHSVGEFVAACVAGVFSFEDALRLVAIRGRLMQQMARGAMTAVPLSATDVEALLDDDLSIAAVNAPRLTVVSGPIEAVVRFEREQGARGVLTRRLRTSHAFHSSMMDRVCQPFADAVSSVARRAPSIPLISNVTGTWMTDQEAVDVRYWARQLRAPVQFADGLRTLLRNDPAVLAEVGPGRALGSLARQMRRGTVRDIVLEALSHDAGSVTDTLASLWLSGVTINWLAVHESESHQKVTLPTYPFERRRYWIDPTGTAPVAVPDGARRLKPSEWFAVPTWVRKSAAHSLNGVIDLDRSSWLVLAPEGELGAEMAVRLRERGCQVTVLHAPESFASGNGSSVRLAEREYYRSALADLDGYGGPPRVVHIWSLSGPDAAPPASRSLLGGLYSLLGLAQALLERYPGQPVRIDVISDGIYRVHGDEPLVPVKRALVAACHGISQEYPQLVCRLIDLKIETDGREAARDILDCIIHELTDPNGPTQMALRNGLRWVPTLERVDLAPVSDRPPRLRRGGVYLITGGLGQIGLALARHLASGWNAKLVLVGRTAVPERAEWPLLLSGATPDDPIANRVRALQELENAGGEVMVVEADVSKLDDMRRVLDQTRARFGELHGVIHSAGLTTPDGFAPLDVTDIALCERQLQPKAGGALVLAELLSDVDLDFVMLMSSLSSVLVGLGFIPYAAANLVLDALAETFGDDRRTSWVSVNWDGWDFSNHADGVRNPRGRDLVLAPAEGCDAFDRILAAPRYPQVLVSTTDLSARIQQWINLARARAEEQDAAPRVAASLHARPDLTTSYVAPRTSLERSLAETWQALLGIARVGADDNFFELGGHSLLAIQLTSRIRETFRIDVPVRALFDAPTVAGLAGLIEAGLTHATADEERISRVLERVERISDEEMRALLDAQPRRQTEHTPGDDPSDVPTAPVSNRFSEPHTA